MPKKIPELKATLSRAGWVQIPGGGKGSHSKWSHRRVARKVVLSGNDGEDASRKQERDIEMAVREAGEG